MNGERWIGLVLLISAVVPLAAVIAWGEFREWQRARARYWGAEESCGIAGCSVCAGEQS